MAAKVLRVVRFGLATVMVGAILVIALVGVLSGFAITGVATAIGNVLTRSAR